MGTELLHDVKKRPVKEVKFYVLIFLLVLLCLLCLINLLVSIILVGKCGQDSGKHKMENFPNGL